MKKLVSLFVLATVLACAVSSCGEDAAPTTPTPTPVPPTAAPATATPTAEGTAAPEAPTTVPTGQGLEATPLSGASDLIFHNGTVVTMEAAYPEVSAIAIQGDKIMAVGSDQEILALQEPETQLVDLAGRTLLPGFIDGHTHVLRSPDLAGKTMDEAMALALSYGLTGVTEMSADWPYLERLMEAERDGRLRLRVNVFPEYNAGILDDEGKRVYMGVWFPDHGPVFDHDRRLRIPGIKIFVDGGFTPGRGCWAVTDPYSAEFQAQAFFSEICFSERGDLYFSQDELNQAVADAQASGFRVSFHAMGDRGIDAALDAIEYALNGESNERYRHQIQHNSMLRPDQLQRYASLNALGSVRGYFNTCEQDGYLIFGPDRFEWLANRMALAGLGIHAYAEGDFGWTMDPADRTSPRPIDPLLTLYGLVTHKQLREDGSACEPDDWIARHQIGVERALQMLTIEPAFAVSQEDVLGTLRPGKFADLVILSGDPLAVDPDTIKDLRVLMTMVGGRVEYCAPGHEALCPGTAPTPEPTDTPLSPTQTTVPATATPTTELGPRVEISLAARETWVSANTPVVLRLGWVTDAPQQVADFLGSVQLVVTLDGELLRDTGNYWSEIEEDGDSDGDGDMDYQTLWRYPVGVLSPGTHRVESEMRLQWPVTDGFDSNGDGVADVFSGTLEFSLQIVVGD
jgi:predicted amidohydrolase YtcJ